jgi:hypothetical protein
LTGENGTGRKLLWFVGLWAGGVLTVTVVGFAIKLALGQ